MTYYIYFLWSSKLRKRYVGSAGNVKRRLIEHSLGRNKFTKGGIAWKLIHQEAYNIKFEALRREKFLKSGQGRMWLNEKFPEYRRGAGVV